MTRAKKKALAICEVVSEGTAQLCRMISRGESAANIKSMVDCYAMKVASIDGGLIHDTRLNSDSHGTTTAD